LVLDMSLFLTATIAGILGAGSSALLATGFYLTLGVLDVVNFAYGAMIVVGSYSALEVGRHLGVTPLLGVIVAVPVCYLLALTISRLVLRHDTETIFQLLVTFGVAILLEGMLSLLFGPGTQAAQNSLSSASIHLGSLYVSSALLVIFLIGVVVLGLVATTLRYTALGRATQALSQSSLGASVCGIRTGRLRTQVFAIGSALGGLAGAVVAIRAPFSPFSGLELLITAFIVVALGGLRSILGLCIAALVVGLLQSYSASYLSAYIYQPLLYVVLIVTLWIRPRGFVGGKAK